MSPCWSEIVFARVDLEKTDIFIKLFLVWWDILAHFPTRVTWVYFINKLPS